MTASFRLGSLAVAVMSIAGCGGGGGGGGDEGGFTLSPSSLRFELHRSDVLPVEQVIEATITDPAVAFIAVGAPADEEPPSWLIINYVDTSSNPVRIPVAITNPALPPGTYRSRIRIATGRADQSLIGYQDVPVTYVVDQVLEVSSINLLFQQVYGGPAPDAQTLAIENNGGLSFAWTATVTSDPAGFLRLAGATQASGSGLPVNLPVTVQSNALPGAYYATLSITGNGERVDVTVAYFVSAPQLTLSSSAVAFSIDKSSTSSALERSLVTGSTGARLVWTASSSAPWVAVVPSTGASGDTVAVTLLPDQLGPLPNGAHEATVTLTYSGASLPEQTSSLSVNLDLLLPTLHRVTPYVIVPGAQDRLVIRGSGLAGTTAADLLFGDTPAASLTAVGDTELLAVPPSLSAGGYPVRISNSLGLDRSTASLKVVAPTAYATASLPYPEGGVDHTVTGLVYDAERGYLFVSLFNFGVVRYQYSGGAWGAPVWGGYPGAKGIALSPDGSKLLELSDTSVAQIDPVSLYASPVDTLPVWPANRYYFRGIAVADDGNALVVFTDGQTSPDYGHVYLYSIDGSSFTDTGTNLGDGGVGASGDGSRVAVSSGLYDPLTGQFTRSSDQAAFSTIVFDTRGTRAVTGSGWVVDGNLALVGYLPYSSYGSRAAAPSPDGRRVYMRDSSNNVLRTFDVTTPGAMVEIGSGTPIGGKVGYDHMVVSADGGTIFLAGYKGVLVVPAP